MQYTDHFRTCRKIIRQYIGSYNASLRLEPLQELEARRFLLHLLEEPEPGKLRKHIRTEAGAIALKIAYGYSIDTSRPDPLVDLAEETMDIFSQATCPGRWIVDIMPACELILSTRRRYQKFELFLLIEDYT